jgi:hypothetical protein
MLLLDKLPALRRRLRIMRIITTDEMKKPRMRYKLKPPPPETHTQGGDGVCIAKKQNCNSNLMACYLAYYHSWILVGDVVPVL